MNFKKTIIKSIAFTFALGFIGFLSPQVTKAANAVVFDGIEEKITATGYKFWGLAKEVDEKKDVTIASKHYKIDELFPIETAGIDLS